MELRTERLVLREPVLDDWRAAMLFLGDREVVQWFHLGPEPLSEATAEGWIAELVAHNSADPRHSYNFLIAEAESGRLVGWIGIGTPSKQGVGDLDFGYGLARECWGQGYMTEAVEALLQFGFTALAANSIFATCRVANLRSSRVLEKSGLRRVKQYADESGHEQFLYSVRREEWSSRSVSRER